MKKSHSAGGVVINQHGKIAVVAQRTYLRWSLPKGGVEAGESDEQAARREIYEETGLVDLELVEEYPVYDRIPVILPNWPPPENQRRKSIKMFRFKTTSTKLVPIDPSNPHARWADKNEAIELLTHPSDKEFLKSVEV